MSCLNKRRFENRIKDDRRTPYDKYVVSGNCGRCAGCAKTKQNDWLVRGYFEYLSRPYQCFFASLDFDEENLPRYKGVPCFDSHLMTRFIESLRQRLGVKFRFLYSSHLGDALHRPHYHVMFFLFEKVEEYVFFQALNDIWHYGSHTDISQLRSVNSPLDGIQYVCRYTVQPYKVRKMFKDMPMRYRPKTFASIGFGAQALDPVEFDSPRLSSEITHLPTPQITRSKIMNGEPVYLDLSRNGIEIPFSIPIYYQYKLFYDCHPVDRYTRDDVTGELKVVKSSELIKNEFGKQLQKTRHNAHYMFLYNDFVNSASLPIHNDIYVQNIVQAVFPDSPYLGVSWFDVVKDVTSDVEKFQDFCKYYNWLQFDCSQPGYTRYRPLRFTKTGFPFSGKYQASHDLPEYRLSDFTLKGFGFRAAQLDRDKDLFDGDIDLYIYAMSEYQIYKDVERYRKNEFEEWKIQEQIKKKIYEKSKQDRSFYWHLRRKHFNFQSLKPKPYVSSQFKTREDSLQE